MRPEPKPATSTKEQRAATTPAPTLTSTALLDRVAALANRRSAIETERAAAIRELDTAREAVYGRERAALTSLEAEHVAAERAAMEGFTARARRSLPPLVDAWCASGSRGAAGALSQELLALRVIEDHELGAPAYTPRAVQILGHVLIERPGRPDIIAAIAQPWTRQDNAVAPWVQALGEITKHTAHVLELAAALTAAEIALAKIGDYVVGFPDRYVLTTELEARWKLLCQCAGPAELDAFDRANLANQNRFTGGRPR